MSPQRFEETKRLFYAAKEGKITLLISFYALHELLILALQNSPDKLKGLSIGKAVLEKVLNQELLVLPLLTKEEKIKNTFLFSKLRDSSDIPHAISAHLNEVRGIITYDQHFKDISDKIKILTPNEALKEIEK